MEPQWTLACGEDYGHLIRRMEHASKCPPNYKTENHLPVFKLASQGIVTPSKNHSHTLPSTRENITEDILCSDTLIPLL